MILTSLLFFTIGAIVAGTANGFGPLLVGRSLQGIGGGGMIALTEIVVTDLVPLRQRGQWYGIISGMWSVGSVAGPIVGGVFAQKVTWVCSLLSRRTLRVLLMKDSTAMDLLYQPSVCRYSLRLRSSLPPIKLCTTTFARPTQTG